MARATKRSALMALPKRELVGLARSLDLPTAGTKASLVDALTRTRKVNLGTIVDQLGKEALLAICQAHDLPTRGGLKALRARILEGVLAPAKARIAAILQPDVPPASSTAAKKAPAAKSIQRCFEGWVAARGASLTEMTVSAVVELFVAFHDAVVFSGRAQGTYEDMLLLQTGQPEGAETWEFNLTRQLYKGGRGHQLSVSLYLPLPGSALPDNPSLWSKDCESVAAWGKDALSETVRFGVAKTKPVEVKVFTASF